MKTITMLLIKIQGWMGVATQSQLLASLALRAYLVPVFWVAGMNKVNSFDDVAMWFGNPDWGLGLPFPTFVAFLATASEVGGAVLLALGLATRWAIIPLLVTMLVATFSVHWQNGWQAVADLKSPWPNEHAADAIDLLDQAKSILQDYGNYDLLTEHGSFVVSNNGIEWAATYFVMLLALFYLGGGKYISADYWLRRKFMPNA